MSNVTLLEISVTEIYLQLACMGQIIPISTF